MSVFDDGEEEFTIPERIDFDMAQTAWRLLQSAESTIQRLQNRNRRGMMKADWARAQKNHRESMAILSTYFTRKEEQ